MITFADVPTLGLLIGGLVTIGIALACVALAVWTLTDDGSYGDVRAIGWGAIVVLVITIGIAAFAFWPWKYEYHFWQDKQGKVERISNRFVGAGSDGGTKQKFVVVLHGQPYGIDDTRASLLEVGDYVRLRCKKAFVWGSTDGWDCNWRGQ